MKPLKPENSPITRRDLIKCSLASGAVLATGLPLSAVAANKSIPPEFRPEHAKLRFLESMNCSQAILETYAPEFGLSVENARKVAAAFAGGMGMGTECGAVTGAFMVIGMKYGKTRDDDSRADSETFKRLARFVEEFKAKHGHIECSSLLETDMGTPEGVKEAAGKGYFTSRCPVFVKTASQLLEKILA